MEISVETDKKYKRTDENRAFAKETRRKDNESHFTHYREGKGTDLLILSHLFPKNGIVKNIALRVQGLKDAEKINMLFEYSSADEGGLNTLFSVTNGINTFQNIPVKKFGLVNLSFEDENDISKIDKIHIAYIYKT